MSGNGRKTGSYDASDHTPKLLPCSHTICLQCLTVIAADAGDEAEILCPICRQRISVPAGGVSSLPPSYIVNQLLEMMKKQRKDVIQRCSTHPHQVEFWHKQELIVLLCLS